jgi:hypothetical protein
VVAVIARAGQLTEQHDRERKEKALTDASSMLASAGLSLKDLAAKGSGARAPRHPVYRNDQSYRHPAKPELVWNAKGQEPAWPRNWKKKAGVMRRF